MGAVLPALFQINIDRGALIDDPGGGGRILGVVTLSHIYRTVLAGTIIQPVPFHPGAFLKDPLFIKLIVFFVDRGKLCDTDTILIQIIAMVLIGDPARLLFAL